jgi:hypothetical protein
MRDAELVRPTVARRTECPGRQWSGLSAPREVPWCAQGRFMQMVGRVEVTRRRDDRPGAILPGGAPGRCPTPQKFDASGVPDGAGATLLPWLVEGAP